MLEDEVFQIASRHLKRAKMGAQSEISAICPFHRKPGGGEEKNPSFTLNASKGVYYCHTCHSSGTFRQFLKDVGVGLQIISLQYGPLIEALQKNRKKDFDPVRAKGLLEENPLPEYILGLFDTCPLPMVDPEFRLQEDDPVFDEKILQRMDIGFDEKHCRITFPLRDLMGNLIGISGRACDPSTFPRYKVYDTEYKEFGLPQREQTKKSTVLWNAHNVYSRVFRGSSREIIYVVEGFKALLWLLQAGIDNVVALAGSSVSEFHHWIFERMGARLALMFDNDFGGENGLLKAAPLLAKSLDVDIVQYEARQPTSMTLEEVRFATEKCRKDYYLWVSNKRMELKNGIR